MEVRAPLRARAPAPSDAEALLAMLLRSDHAETGEPGTDLGDIRSVWRLPGFDLARDAALVEGPEGPVAYAWVHAGREGDVQVDPAWRGQGLGARLLDWLVARARGHAGGEGRLQLEAVSHNQAARRLLDRAGFVPTRATLLMGVELDRPLPLLAWPPGVSQRPFLVERDARALHALVSQAFADIEGTRPRPFEEWEQLVLAREGFDPALVFQLVAAGRPVGALIGQRFEDEGFVQYLAVDRAWRRCGLGLALLRLAFAEFAGRGLAKASLIVDADNSTGATHLYERAGMGVRHRWDRWELALA